MNSVSMNMAGVSFTHANQRIFISFGYRPKTEIARSGSGSVFDSFEEYPLCYCSYACCHSHHQHEEFPFSTSLQSVLTSI